MFDKFRDECGVFGIYGHTEAAKLAYLGLYALQHRGQESAGIATADGTRIRAVREMGYVNDIFDQQTLATLPGHVAIGHTRYSTAGESKLSNAQPIVIDCVHGPGRRLPQRQHRQRQRDPRAAGEGRVDLPDQQRYRGARASLRAIAGGAFDDALVESLAQLSGAFSFAVLIKDHLIAARDPHGFRPLALGRLGEAWVVCSETCALDLINATYVRDVEPGELLVIGPEGVRSRRVFPNAPLSHCVFEHVYFARPDSEVFGQSVNEVRTNLGRLLAKETAVPADVVVPIPDSGVCAAIGYAEEAELPMRFGLIRNHYVGRTFIEPAQSIRHFGVKVKLNPVRSILAGRRVVLVDDSIVRGTTSRKIVKMVRAAGASEVHLRISCPPTVSPCFYGVDTPRRSELIAATHSLEEIRKYVGADSFGYLSLEGLLERGRHATPQLLHVVLYRAIPGRVSAGCRTPTCSSR